MAVVDFINNAGWRTKVWMLCWTIALALLPVTYASVALNVFGPVFAGIVASFVVLPVIVSVGTVPKIWKNIPAKE